MKVGTLLKTLSGVEYVIQSQTGCLLEKGYITEDEHRLKIYDSCYWGCNVLTIKTVQNNDVLYISVER